MGNISSMARASTALDSYVAELGNDISYDKSLSSSRFLKTILARHAYGPLVLKIFIKPDATMSLRTIQVRLKTERDALADLGSVNTYQAFIETDKAGYLIRQWAGSNLYDRVSTQPYLANIEKRWIAFQLLTALRDTRARKVSHGDIKSENVLITSDLTVLLTDFSSSFKPTYLPLDDPSNFSFFFDTSARRTCYLAPERFYAADSKIASEKKGNATTDGNEWSKRDGRITEAMDVFSAGCVIAEMWTDGRTVFNLSELFAYREGSVGLEGILENIEDEHVKTMISQMLSREPADRPSFDHILSAFRGTIFPEFFYTFLQDYISSLAELPDSPSSAFLKRAASQPGTKIDRMLDEWDSIQIHLDEEAALTPALPLLNIVTSSIRNCLWPASRLHGLKLFLNLAPYLSDEDKVDRVVPFIVELLADEVAIVRAEACRTLVLIISPIESISPQNATFLPEYLLPQMRHLATDPDIFVRATYAKSLVTLADAAVTMLEFSQAVKVPKSELESTGIVEPDYDAMLAEIQAVVEEQATTLLVDTAPAVKRSMLNSIADLCLFFGRQKSSETVLSHIMTYLNDRDWPLRFAFFDGIVGVGAFIGIRAIEEYVLPLMMQSLGDPEEAVVARVISSLSSLTSLGLMPRMRIWDVFASVKGFLCHPNSWIRQSTAGFVAAAARNLPPSDAWCIVYPALRTMLHSDILEMDEESILLALTTPLSRATLVAAKTAALQKSPPGFWNTKSSKTSAKSSLVKSAIQQPANNGHQLKDKGISRQDEKKIVAMKEFIVKQAQAAQARGNANQELASSENDLTAAKSVSLTELGVTPQTVFISPRTVGVDVKADLRRLRPHLAEPTSRRTSFASRSARGAVENPLDEIRKRLASLEPPTPRSERAPSDHAAEASPSESALSSSIDLANVTKPGRKRLESKAAPAIGASHTTAIGTTSTSIHDEIMSGATTPLAGISTPRTTAPYSSSYEGHDPGVRAFLEQVDLENYRAPLLDFGPRITAAGKKRINRPKSSGAQTVTLIAHLTQHTGPVNAIIASPDHLFFATASEDTQLLIWDSARLERSVTAKARLIYRMDAPISALCRIENTHSLAVAAEDGQLHVLRVHVTTGSNPRYSKIECIRSWAAGRGDGHVVTVSHLQDSSLLIVTSTSVIGLLDIRTMEVKTRFQHPLHLGNITATCTAAHWLIVGTNTGTLSLWDLRFGLLLKSWRASGPITAISIHPARGKGRWIMVSTMRKANSPLVEVFDIETSRLFEQYEVRLTRPSSKNLPPPPDHGEPTATRAEYIAELAKAQTEAQEDGVPFPSVTSVLVGQGFAGLAPGYDEDGGVTSEDKQGGAPGWMITAGEDRAVRYWDLSKVSDGFVVCGSQKEKDVSFRSITSASPTTIYTVPNSHRQPSDPKHAGVTTTRQPLRPHYDVISALGAIETPFSSCVISADRSGIIKVWRVESGTATSR